MGPSAVAVGLPKHLSTASYSLRGSSFVCAGVLALASRPSGCGQTCWIDPAQLCFRNPCDPPSSGNALISQASAKAEVNEVRLKQPITWRISQVAKVYRPPLHLAAFGVCALTLVA